MKYISTPQKEKDDKKKKKKKKDDWLEKEIFAFMEKSAGAAINAALDEILKDWK